jgi:uncharacterized membrane protein YgdD (TMEM256/DUF423 family)
MLGMTYIRIAAALCFLAVALGAFGAHALRSTRFAPAGSRLDQSAGSPSSFNYDLRSQRVASIEGAAGSTGSATIESNGLLNVWDKAVFYHFIHAIALLVLALYGNVNRGSWWLLFAGIFLFSGSLYAMALTNLHWLGAITPLGGLCFLAGWAWLAMAPRH